MATVTDTRTRILDRAVQLAAERGLAGVSVGILAGDLSLSKSGLFAHFGSKERLDRAILERSAARFADHVSRPAYEAPPGRPRFLAVFDRWLAWGSGPINPAGCPFLAVAPELDDRPGPVRDFLHRLQRDWLSAVARIVADGTALGQFRTTVDPDQAVFELFGILAAAHHRHRLLGYDDAPARAGAAFSELVRRLEVPPAKR